MPIYTTTVKPPTSSLASDSTKPSPEQATKSVTAADLPDAAPVPNDRAVALRTNCKRLADLIYADQKTLFEAAAALELSLPDAQLMQASAAYRDRASDILGSSETAREHARTIMAGRTMVAAVRAAERLHTFIDSDDEGIAAAASRDALDRVGMRAATETRSEVVISLDERTMAAITAARSEMTNITPPAAIDADSSVVQITGSQNASGRAEPEPIAAHDLPDPATFAYAQTTTRDPLARWKHAMERPIVTATGQQLRPGDPHADVFLGANSLRTHDPNAPVPSDPSDVRVEPLAQQPSPASQPSQPSNDTESDAT